MDSATAVHAGTKLTWIEAVADDPAVTGLTLKVAVKLSQRTERDGVARTASQGWIAKRLGTDERTVRRCVLLLRELGHIERCGVGSRGRAAEYRLITQGANARASVSAYDRTSSSERPDTAVRKHAPGCPPLPISNKNLLPLERKPDGLNSLERCWWAIKERLAAPERFGKDKTEAWLGKVRIGHIADGEVILIAPSKFLANRNGIDPDVLLREWRQVDPAIKRVIFRHGELPQSPAAAEQVSEPTKVVPLRERLKAKYAGSGSKTG